MPRFVILRHTLPADSPRPSHFDLMLEHDGELLTWAVVELPSASAQTAEELPLHRLDYLTFEGPVSHNRGEVQRVAGGAFDWLEQTENNIQVKLHSPQFTGQLKLHRTSTDWSVTFIAD